MDTNRIIQFFRRDIWRIRRKDLPPIKAFLIRQLRIFVLTFRSFAENKCQLRASALTYYTLLSIVPVLAMAFGIAKGFGFEQGLQRVVFERLEGQEEVALKIVDFAHALLNNVKGGLMAGIGTLILFFTIIKILSHIENAFNHIWGIQKPRTLPRKISDYLSVMVIGPVLFLMSGTITVVMNRGVTLIVQKITVLGPIAPFIFFMLSFFPYAVIWILFSFLYIYLPNTKVNFISGILAGLLAGTMYQIFQWAYINFQVLVTKYNTIYGSFAAIPLFFIWLQVSWLIVLFGAEVCFAHQNVDTYEFEEDCRNVSHAFKRLVSLRIVHLLVSHFSNGDEPLTADQISKELDMPIRLVHLVLFELVSAGILSEIGMDEGRDLSYQPARDPDRLTIKYIIDGLEHLGSDVIPLAQSEELERISDKLKDFSDLIESSAANRPLKAL
jgi:membrane protein